MCLYKGQYLDNIQLHTTVLAFVLVVNDDEYECDCIRGHQRHS